jgi:riboflavin synthase
MFTGIVEAIGVITQIGKEASNIRYTIQSPFTSELKIDQSVSHNGVCLTVVDILGEEYEVIAIEETLSKTNLSKLKVGDKVNLERSMQMSSRLDGHLVQGHVDETAICKNIEEKNGSWFFSLESTNRTKNILIPKGSICLNGVSLTVVDAPTPKAFSVAIIPYTFQNTNFQFLKPGDEVNIEFDVIGKYVQRILGDAWNILKNASS